MTSTGTNLQTGTTTQIIQQQPTQVVIQQQSASQQQQTIRKVGSSGNLSSLQQKVQVFNRPSIQIVQAGAQRAKPATVQNTQSLGAGNTNQPSNNAGTTSGPTTTTTNAPLQFQQVFQQQQNAKLNTNTTGITAQSQTTS